MCLNFKDVARRCSSRPGSVISPYSVCLCGNLNFMYCNKQPLAIVICFPCRSEYRFTLQAHPLTPPPCPAPKCHCPSQCFTADLVRCQFCRHRPTLVVTCIQCPVCPKLHTFYKSPGLKTSKGQYSVIVIARPVGNRK